MLAVLPEEHPLAGLDVVPLELLAVEPNIRYTIHDDYAIMTIVEAGLGVSILAELILHRTNYRLVLRPAEPPIASTIAIGYKDKNSLPIASKRFLFCLQNHIEELPQQFGALYSLFMRRNF